MTGRAQNGVVLALVAGILLGVWLLLGYWLLPVFWFELAFSILTGSLGLTILTVWCLIAVAFVAAIFVGCFPLLFKRRPGVTGKAAA